MSASVAQYVTESSRPPINVDVPLSVYLRILERLMSASRTTQLDVLCDVLLAEPNPAECSQLDISCHLATNVRKKSWDRTVGRCDNAAHTPHADQLL